MKMYSVACLMLAITLVLACQSESSRLPILGPRNGVQTRVVEGKTVTDTVYHQIPDFAFASQYGDTVTAKYFAGKIYIADFFFTTCPTICPKMTMEMRKLYQKFKDDPQVMFLSHSIDPKRDSVGRLREYSTDLGVYGQKQWYFVTGDRKEIFDIGQNAYFVSAKEDSDEPGGLLHSGAFIVIDPQRRIRGIYDGTKDEVVGEVSEAIELLKKEN
ncbi:SCO family protein [Siphonobacter sp. BAB-5385]|uniref:SCO family protein n=1 Tax=Siphonobacter sp. BAB-5385 TaxID=1864822 RepID=UPI0020CBAFA1|nr:SCO family protein [Siphonobacter sp. BAB-5385]